MQEQSNEDLSLRIKNGEKDLIPQLWERVCKFISMKSWRYYEAALLSGVRLSWEAEDLEQEAYFAFVDSIEDYHHGIGANFLTILAHRLKWTFLIAFGKKVASRRYDLFRSALYGDSPAGDESTATLLDFVSDPTTDIEEESTQDLYIMQLHEALEKSISMLTLHQQEIIRALYYGGLSKSRIAEQMHIEQSTIYKIEKNALAKMYEARQEAGLDQFLDVHTNFYLRIGADRFATTWTSAVEELAIRRAALTKDWLKKQNRKKGGPKKVERGDTIKKGVAEAKRTF